MKRCVLLSGGIDSIAVCYWQRPEFAVTIDYGQVAAQGEISAATEVAKWLRVQHIVIRADCSGVGLGDMVRQRAERSGPTEGLVVPTTDWWPFRNQLLVTLAAAKCVDLGIRQILLGSVKTDGLHKDGLPQFYDLLDRVMSFQEGEISIGAPAIQMTSLELVRSAAVPLSLLAWAHSCNCSDLPCSSCRGCTKYRQVWAELRRT